MKSLFYPVLLLFHAVFISLGNDSKMIKYICVVLLMVYLFHKKVYFTAQVSNGEPSLTFIWRNCAFLIDPYADNPFSSWI